MRLSQDGGALSRISEAVKRSTIAIGPPQIGQSQTAAGLAAALTKAAVSGASA